MNRRALVAAVAIVLIASAVAIYIAFAHEPASQPSGEAGPTAPRDTLTKPAIDTAGPWGAIALTRRGQRPLRPGEGPILPDATSVVEVHVAYAPDRRSTRGFGMFDWQVWVDGQLDAAGSPHLFPALPINGPELLRMQLPEGVAPLSGVIGIPTGPSASGKAVFLVYAPITGDAPDNNLEPKVASQVRVLGR